jgi:hypothetical protein
MQMYVFQPATVVTLSVSPGPGSVVSGRATFGPQNYSTTAALVVGSPNTGCSALASVTGKIVVLDRSVCSFTSQALNAQNAGAVGVLIVNNVAGPAPALGGPTRLDNLILSTGASPRRGDQAQILGSTTATMTGASS